MSAIVQMQKPRITAKQFSDWKREQKETRQVMDTFSNVLARTGFGTSNLLQGSSYPVTRLSYNYILLQSLYRNDWIARKVIDGMPDDMTKNWISLETDTDPKELERF